MGVAQSAAATSALPDRSSIPPIAYLVVGGAYNNEVGERPFFKDEHFYILDKLPPHESNNRYIQVDFNDWNGSGTGKFDEIYKQYLETFDIIIFDDSVVKFIDIKTQKTIAPVINRLQKMLKVNGYLIIDTSFIFTKPITEITDDIIKERFTEMMGPNTAILKQTMDPVDPIIKTAVDAVYTSKSYHYFLLKKETVKGGKRYRQKRITRHRRRV
jgi:hypothetical protein